MWLHFEGSWAELGDPSCFAAMFGSLVLSAGWGASVLLTMAFSSRAAWTTLEHVPGF